MDIARKKQTQLQVPSKVNLSYGEKVQGISSINGRQKIDRGRLGIV